MSAACLSLSLVLGPSALWWTDLLIMAGIYAVLGLSLNLINGHGRMFSLGHHGFWAVGAYAAAALSAAWTAEPPGLVVFLASTLGVGQGPVVFAASVVAAVTAAGLSGLLVGPPCLRLRGDYLAVATLGFAEIVRLAIQNLPATWLGGAKGLPMPAVLGEVTPDTKGVFRVAWTVGMIVVVALVAWGLRNLVRSPRGRAMLAVAEDETAAKLLGIDPTRSKVSAFLLGSALAGLAGALFAHYQAQGSRLLPSTFSFDAMVRMLLVVVLGGLGSITGCVLAAFLLRYVDQALQAQGQGTSIVGVPALPEAVGRWLVDWWPAVYALALVLLMIFRPRGLLGSRELSDLFRRRRRPAGAPT